MVYINSISLSVLIIRRIPFITRPYIPITLGVCGEYTHTFHVGKIYRLTVTHINQFNPHFVTILGC